MSIVNIRKPKELAMVIRTLVSLTFVSIFSFFAFVRLASAQPGEGEQLVISSDHSISNTHIDNIMTLNSRYDDATPVISADENALYFTSYRSGKAALYRSTRESAGTWTQPTLFIELPSKENISAISLSADGKTAVLQCCNREDAIDRTCDIYAADVSGTTLTNIRTLGSNVNSEWWDAQPSVSSDGQLLFFASDRKKGAGGIDIYMASRNPGGDWGAPSLLSFCTGNDELSPFIADDNQTLYFASDASGGQGGYDIYVTYRTGDNSWSAPKNLGLAVNSRGDELFFFVPPKENALYVSSNRDGSQGGMDLYRIAPNPAPPKPKSIAFRGRVLDAETGDLVRTEPDVTLEVSGAGERLTNTSSGKSYSTDAPIGKRIKVSAGANGYANGNIEVQAPSAFSEAGFSEDIKLTPAKVTIYGNVTNVFTGKAVAATITLEEIDGNGNVVGSGAEVNADPARNNAAYEFTGKSPFAKYRISAVANKDYDPYTSTVDVPAKREAVIRIEKHVRLQPSNIDAVMLNFDYDKADLLRDQLPQLDRFIGQVKENPYLRIEIAGHTDDRGSDEYNEKLSARRALAVEEYLLSKGVPRDQLAVVKGFGKANPLIAGTSDEARAKNRRVEVRIVGKQ